ncbi:hypothetical protein SCUP515_06894 [Seiridium cupressi]
MAHNWKGATTAEDVVERLGMNWNEEQRQQYINSIKVVELKRLREPYPTDDYFMATTEAGKDHWDRFWYQRRTKDKRYNGGKRREVRVLDESKLQYTIPQDESVIFRDADTKEIFMIILRNFFPDDQLRMDMVDTCRWILKYRRDDRREDPGQLVHFGYTCGSRHDPGMDLARNRRKITDREHRELNNAAQGMAGIGWNMLRGRMPQFIIDDYNNTIKSIPGCPRMDMRKTKELRRTKKEREMAEGVDNTFSYEVDGCNITFNRSGDLELPPPSGLAGYNYARFTHQENNGNEWFVAVTCIAADDPSIGGNFYNASYGIMMLAASNTISAFKPTDFHGTTLFEMVVPDGVYDTNDPRWQLDGRESRPDGGENIGFAFEVSKGLKYAKRKGDEKVANKPGRGGKRIRRTVYGADPVSDPDSDGDYRP